jgi:carbonic anhydrase/acetyltransferase-like protein (isoleucine patch superfamily)
MKKYKLGPKETFSQGGTFIRAHRITALIDIPAHDVRAGDLGGWVGSRRNLSHDGDCWIGQNAVVADACRVKDDALVTGNATLMYECKVSGNAVIKDNAILQGKIIVQDNAVISDKASITAPEYYDAEDGYTISENAQIMGAAKINGKGYIKGSALIKGEPKIQHLRMSGNTIIAGHPNINNCALEDTAQIFGSAEVWTTELKGQAKVYGQSSIFKGAYYTRLTDNVRVFGHVRIYGSHSEPATILSGNVNVYDNATIKEGCNISGASIINEYAHVLENCHISGNSKVSGPQPLPARYKASNLIQDSSGIKSQGIQPQDRRDEFRSQPKNNANYIGAYAPSPISSALKKRPTVAVAQTIETKSIEPIRAELAEIIAKVEKDYDEYKNDVVKLIKYPIMVDLKDELTLNFTFALRKAKREVSYGQNTEKMEESVETLERTFLMAEANAQKIGSSKYSDQEVKKTDTAKQMLAVALDEKASENERRISFKQAFKVLEGIIAVPDSAIETMKLQVGLKELEA